MCILTHRGYGAGHPFYYLLGGEIPPIKAIRACTIAGSYRGYLADEIDTLAAKPEPGRSAAIRDMRAQLVAGLREDFVSYRQCAHALRLYRARSGELEADRADDVHVVISLKFNHILNGFANLRTLDSLPRQGDLFEGL